MKSLFLTLLLLAFGVVSFARSDETAKSKLEANHPAVADRLDEATNMLKDRSAGFFRFGPSQTQVPPPPLLVPPPLPNGQRLPRRLFERLHRTRRKDRG